MWHWTLILFVSGSAAAWSDAFGLRWYGAGLLVLAALLVALRVRGHILFRRRARAVEGLRAMPPDAFEAEVARWLRREGYHVEARGGTGDGGVDLVARRGNETLAVQCKRYAAHAAVSAAQVRDLYGAAVAEGSTRALLVTTGRVSKAARAWAEALPVGPPLTVIDAEVVGELAVGRRRALRT